VNVDQAAIFVFESAEPAHVTVYQNLDWARGSLESLDVASDGYEPESRRPVESSRSSHLMTCLPGSR